MNVGSELEVEKASPQRLTPEAMRRYLSERRDSIVIILNAKVRDFYVQTT